MNYVDAMSYYEDLFRSWLVDYEKYVYYFGISFELGYYILKCYKQSRQDNSLNSISVARRDTKTEIEKVQMKYMFWFFKQIPTKGKLAKETITKDIFYDFLESQDAKKEFKASCKKVRSKRKFKLYKRGIEATLKTNPETIIQSAFSWGNSDEGFDFWDDMDSKWLTFLQRYEAVATTEILFNRISGDGLWK